MCKYVLFHLASVHTGSDYQFSTVNKPLTGQPSDSTAGQSFPVLQGPVFHYKALFVGASAVQTFWKYLAFLELSHFVLSEVLEVLSVTQTMLQIFMIYLNLIFSVRSTLNVLDTHLKFTNYDTNNSAKTIAIFKM